MFELRKTALFISYSKAIASNWVKKQKLNKKLYESNLNYSEKTDVIGANEIYTYVKKGNRAVVWTAY